jgi:hypothetical protein
MTRRAGRLFIVAALIAAGFLAGLLLEKKMAAVQAQSKSNFSAAAIAGEKNTQDLSGPYEVVPDWPKPITALPGHEKWTWGAVESVFAETPNRVFILERGEIPAMKRPEEVPYPHVGPSISFRFRSCHFVTLPSGQ